MRLDPQDLAVDHAFQYGMGAARKLKTPDLSGGCGHLAFDETTRGGGAARIGHAVPSAGNWTPGKSSTPPAICVASM